LDGFLCKYKENGTGLLGRGLGEFWNSGGILGTQYLIEKDKYDVSRIAGNNWRIFAGDKES
jgi:hypothetical protein